MRFCLWCIGKTANRHVESVFETYVKRIRPYHDLGIRFFPDDRSAKRSPSRMRPVSEGLRLLKQLQGGDRLVLLDEAGRHFTSIEFARFLESEMTHYTKRCIFAIGGPYGFSEAVYERADARIALSKMTLPHDLVRLFAVEQIYRAFTILRNEKYHH